MKFRKGEDETGGNGEGDIFLYKSVKDGVITSSDSLQQHIRQQNKLYRGEVFKALNKTRGLYLRWQEISKSPVIPSTPEAEWTSTELRNSLRSIEWDLEDLEDTIGIVERNSTKFKISDNEIKERRSFIEVTKREVQGMKNKINLGRNMDSDGTARVPLLGDESPVSSNYVSSWPSSTPKYRKYQKLPNSDSPFPVNSTYDLVPLQDQMLDAQNEQLQVISDTVGSLKSVSVQIGNEIDEQAIMLDDLNTDMEHADSKLESTLAKLAKVLHINNSRRQCHVIIVLSLICLVLIIFFVAI